MFMHLCVLLYLIVGVIYCKCIVLMIILATAISRFQVVLYIDTYTMEGREALRVYKRCKEYTHHSIFYSSSLSKYNSSSSSLSRLTMTGSTGSWMLSVSQYSSSNARHRRTAASHTCSVAQSLASSSLACKSARVKRCSEERTCLFMHPHTCSMALSSG